MKNNLTLAQFREEKIKGREEIKNVAIGVLKGLKPVAIHQFGSGAIQFRDEFSDIDLFTTLSDEQFLKLVPRRDKIYAQVAPILIRLFHRTPNPVGWYHDLVIHETEHGLYHIDYYFTPV